MSRQTDTDPFDVPGLPPRRSVAEETGYWEDLDEEVAATYRFALEHIFPQTYDYTVFGPLYNALDAILKGEQDVEAALAEAQEKARQALVERAQEREEATSQPVVVATPEPETDEGTVITFAPFFANPVAYRELAKTFHETHPEITVKMREPSFTGRYGLEEMASSSDCFVWFSEVADGESLQQVLNLDPFIEAETDFPLDDFYPQALDVFRRQGSLWGLAAEVQMKVIYYNKDLFDAAGVEYPQLGWDLEEFLRIARALTQREGDEKQYGFLPLDGDADALETFVALQGVALIDDQANPPRPRFDAPDVVEAVRWYVELATVHGVKSQLHLQCCKKYDRLLDSDLA